MLSIIVLFVVYVCSAKFIFKKQLYTCKCI